MKRIANKYKINLPMGMKLLAKEPSSCPSTGRRSLMRHEAEYRKKKKKVANETKNWKKKVTNKTKHRKKKIAKE